MNELSLLLVGKPARYVNGEVNSIRKEDAELKWVLLFPDLYEIGMSSLGIQILYHVLNKEKWIWAERCFAPYIDYEALLRKRGELLRSLESQTPLNKFDVVGISLTTELNYTNALLCLEMGGIPLNRKERNGYPIVIAGGPACVNPVPLSQFFDAFFIGEAEEGVIEMSKVIREGKRNELRREEILKELSKIEGVYVPEVHSESVLIKRRLISNLDSAPYPLKPVLPHISTVHDRAVVEIARGCTKGCRFCLAGFVTRPVRERSPAKVVDLVKKILRNTGYEQLSFLSLNTCDYTRINELVISIMDFLKKKQISLSLPSIRIGTLSEKVLEGISKVMRTGITLAPETGSEELRKVINKPFSNEELLRDVERAAKHGWDHVKLYFMIGLPTEKEADRMEIVKLVKEVIKAGKKHNSRFHVVVHISVFVPKSHTPFQWEKQIEPEEAFEWLKLLRGKIKSSDVKVKYQSPYLSFIEGILARGDSRIGEVIESAYKSGARFDGWTENFNRKAWEVSFEKLGVDPMDYLKERDETEQFPWDFIDVGVKKEFLLSERNKAKSKEGSDDCFRGKCIQCGVCDFDKVFPDSRDDVPMPVEFENTKLELKIRLRLKLTKEGKMKFLGYTDFMTAFERAVRRSELPIAFSKGFHPHPKFSFGFPPPVGVESTAEYVDVEFVENVTPEEVVNRLSPHLPQGIRILEAQRISVTAPSIFSSTVAFVYRFYADAELIRIISGSLKERKEGMISKYVRELRIRDGFIEVTVKVEDHKTLNPYKFIEEFVKDETIRERIKVKRVETILR